MKRKATTRKGRRQDEGEEEPTITDVEDLVTKHGFASDAVQTFRAALLRWYDENQRALPWRRRYRPPSEGKEDGKEEEEEEAARPVDDADVGYPVWVSEIMLQQTRVETVIAYFKRWMQRWPTLHDLARADPEEVNEAWTGLGYYRRARYLHEGAKKVVDQHGGRLPRTAEALRKIPGIGPYTAGAIASIAYGEVSPVVDGNVIRVLSRLRAIKEDSTIKPVVTLFWTLAQQLVDAQRPGCFNQAMMELGATVCTPKSPKCNACPVSEHCLALRETKEQQPGDEKSVTRYPCKPAKAKQKEESVVVCVVEARDPGTGASSFLLVQRPPAGLLASLWDFPSVNLGSKRDVPYTEARRLMDDYLASLLGGSHPIWRAIARDAALSPEDQKPTTTTTTRRRRREKNKEDENEGSADDPSDDDARIGEGTVERTYAGEATFLFSHIKHFYNVEWLCVAMSPPADHEEDASSSNNRLMMDNQSREKKKKKITKGRGNPAKLRAVRSRGSSKRKREEFETRHEDDGDDEEEDDNDDDPLHSTGDRSSYVPTLRWVSEAGLETAAMPKGMKNCFERVAAIRKLSPQQRRKEASEGRKKQRRIESFFVKNT